MLTIEVNDRQVLDALGAKIYQVQLTVKDGGSAENPSHIFYARKIEEFIRDRYKSKFG